VRGGAGVDVVVGGGGGARPGLGAPPERPPRPPAPVIAMPTMLLIILRSQGSECRQRWAGGVVVGVGGGGDADGAVVIRDGARRLGAPPERPPRPPAPPARPPPLTLTLT
jgi:hypothetical protein